MSIIQALPSCPLIKTPSILRGADISDLCFGIDRATQLTRVFATLTKPTSKLLTTCTQPFGTFERTTCFNKTTLNKLRIYLSVLILFVLIRTASKSVTSRSQLWARFIAQQTESSAGSSIATISGEAAICAIQEMTEAAFCNSTGPDQNSIERLVSANDGLSRLSDDHVDDFERPNLSMAFVKLSGSTKILGGMKCLACPCP